MHNRKILVLSHFFAGCTNDKAIARYNVAIQKIWGQSKEMVNLEWGGGGV